MQLLQDPGAQGAQQFGYAVINVENNSICQIQLDKLVNKVWEPLHDCYE